jgi:large subunit ribosomal protein L20
MTYSQLISGLSKAQVEIDRKILAELAFSDPGGFAKMVEIAKGKLA